MSENQIIINQEIQSVNINQAKQWYAEFSQFSKEVLKSGLDFGVIPGVSKPSLFKPGAEKLALVYKLQPRFEMTDKTVDIETGYISYSYKCTIYTSNNQVRGECEATCHSFEKKYLYRKGGVKNTSEELMYALNTIQKMAQKRAYVGAVLIATGASEFYTQDVEDMGIVSDESSGEVPKEEPKIDLTELVQTFGKNYGEQLKIDGFKFIKINEEQAKECGFSWGEYEKQKEAMWVYVVSDPAYRMKITNQKGYRVSSANQYKDQVEGEVLENITKTIIKIIQVSGAEPSSVLKKYQDHYKVENLAHLSSTQGKELLKVVNKKLSELQEAEKSKIGVDSGDLPDVDQIIEELIN
jgi:hypothetical protein